MNDFIGREFRRLVLVQQKAAELGANGDRVPTMQTPASFNFATVRKKFDAAMKSHEGL